MTPFKIEYLPYINTDSTSVIVAKFKKFKRDYIHSVYLSDKKIYVSMMNKSMPPNSYKTVMTMPPNATIPQGNLGTMYYVDQNTFENLSYFTTSKFGTPAFCYFQNKPNYLSVQEYAIISVDLNGIWYDDIIKMIDYNPNGIQKPVFKFFLPTDK